MSVNTSVTYASVGVDITEIAKIHNQIDLILSRTFRTRRGKIGQPLNVHQHYAGLIKIDQERVLALHADGVGTKVLVASACKQYDTIGIDCVAMNVNDIICVGAEPLALVNYLALDRPQPHLVKQVMLGLQQGARMAGVAIVSGETAIMPDVIRGFDLAATVVGILNRKDIITGEECEEGDIILGLKSSGIHSNGLTLARKVLLNSRTHPAEEESLRELLRPTRIYVREVLKIKRSTEIHGLAHITGGAYSKLKRIGNRAKVGFNLNALPLPHKIFRTIQEKGEISDREMYRTFNMGIGFLIICPKRVVHQVERILPDAKLIGQVTGSRDVIARVNGHDIQIEKW
jgi:phosphoribosylformylglycinamidine cyclo-ligase